MVRVIGRWTAVLVCVVQFYSPAPALSMCGQGQQLSYSDISNVLFERQGCGGLKRAQPKSLSCSGYWIYLSSSGAVYAQWILSGSIGTYKSNVTLSQVEKVLAGHHFYDLNPRATYVTDVRQTVLTVKRCGVVTRVMIYPEQAGERETRRLFAAIDALISKSRLTKINSSPEKFPYSAVFDGL